MKPTITQYRAFRQRGLCGTCGQIPEIGAMCRACLLNQRERRAKGWPSEAKPQKKPDPTVTTPRP